MTSAQAAASQRRVAAIAELDRLGVTFRVEYGFFTVTRPDGEEWADLALSHVEWYCRGIADGRAQVAASIPPMDTR